MQNLLTGTEVLTTTDYFLFKSLSGNREVNELHKKRLMESIENNYLFTIIIVNENYEIIDGQHRFECIAELELPLNYIVCNGYGLKEVQVLNANNKTWTSDDYMHGYIDLGYEAYEQYRDFKNKYKLNHSVAMSILAVSDSGGSTINIFKNGDFKVKDMKYSIEFAEKISKIGQYYDGVFRRVFVASMRKIMNNPVFDFNVFMNKLKLQPTSLKDCTNVENYIIMIENIYNFKNHNKINLRF